MAARLQRRSRFVLAFFTSLGYDGVIHGKDRHMSEICAMDWEIEQLVKAQQEDSLSELQESTVACIIGRENWMDGKS